MDYSKMKETLMISEQKDRLTRIRKHLMKQQQVDGMNGFDEGYNRVGLKRERAEIIEDIIEFSKVFELDLAKRYLM